MLMCCWTGTVRFVRAEARKGQQSHHCVKHHVRCGPVSSVPASTLAVPKNCRQQIVWIHAWFVLPTHTHTHTRLTALFPGLPGWAGTRKVKAVWILLKQGTVSGSGISWAICKSASRSRQITMPVLHHSKFFTGQMPFLPPNQQRQSTEGNSTEGKIATRHSPVIERRFPVSAGLSAVVDTCIISF